jgi:hypothetical protein
MKTYGWVDVQTQVFLTSAIIGGEWSAWRPGGFTSGERAHIIDLMGGWVDTRAGPDDVEKRKILTLPALELRILGCLTRSQSLYGLRYPGSQYWLQGRRDFEFHVWALCERKLRITLFTAEEIINLSPKCNQNW